jgi:hypothetical protein
MDAEELDSELSSSRQSLVVHRQQQAAEKDGVEFSNNNSLSQHSLSKHLQNTCMCQTQYVAP